MNNTLKTISQAGGYSFIFIGLVVAAGSANDCDGACMEQANTLGEMITYALAGMVMMGLGALMALRGQQ
jgi:hypothetical protein